MSSTEDEKMKTRSLRFPDSLWQRAIDKAGMIPLALIIRKLVEGWLSGEITIDTSKK